MSAHERVNNNSVRQATLDLLPYLTEIIKPNLRAVSYVNFFVILFYIGFTFKCLGINTTLQQDRKAKT